MFEQHKILDIVMEKYKEQYQKDFNFAFLINFLNRKENITEEDIILCFSVICGGLTSAQNSLYKFLMGEK